MSDKLQDLQNEIRDIQNKDLVGIKVELGRLKDIQSDLIQNRMEAVQRDLREAKATADGLKGTIANLEALAGTPFYKDRRFLAGLLTVPLLVGGGWILDKGFLGKPAVLGLIHQAAGTQPVILNAIQTDGDPLRSGLETTLATVLTKKELLKPAIDEELLKRFDIVHAGIMELGLNRPERIRKVACQDLVKASAQWGPISAGAEIVADRPCEDLHDATTQVATSFFGLRGYEKVNIDIGVYVGEFRRNDKGDLVLTKVVEPTNLPSISEVLKSTLDEEDVPIPAPRMWIEHRVGNQAMKLAHLRIEGVGVQHDPSQNIFPLHTFTVQLAKKALDTYVISVAVLVTVPKS